VNINQIEPKFKELEKGVDGAMEQIGSIEKRLEQIAARLQEHEGATADDAHGVEVEPTGDEAEQEAETPTEIATETAEEAVGTTVGPLGNVPGAAERIFETAEESVEKEEFIDEDATFRVPEQEPEPEKVEPVATVKVVVSGDLDPVTASLLKRLEHINTDVVKVTVDKRE